MTPSVDIAAAEAAPAPVPAPAAETYDPFPKFGYSGKLRPAYPLSKNKRVPSSIVRPNYAREEVRHYFWGFWWDVRATIRRG